MGKRSPLKRPHIVLDFLKEMLELNVVNPHFVVCPVNTIFESPNTSYLFHLSKVEKIPESGELNFHIGTLIDIILDMEIMRMI